MNPGITQDHTPLDGARHDGVNVCLGKPAVGVGQVVVAGQLQHSHLGRVALVQLSVLQAPQQVALIVACPPAPVSSV